MDCVLSVVHYVMLEVICLLIERSIGKSFPLCELSDNVKCTAAGEHELLIVHVHSYFQHNCVRSEWYFCFHHGLEDDSISWIQQICI